MGRIAMKRVKDAKLIASFITIIGVMFFMPNVAKASQIQGFLQAIITNSNGMTVSGWACERGNESSIVVNLYAGESAQTATLIDSRLANRGSELAVDQRCKTNGEHRFRFELPESVLFDYPNARLFVEAQASTQRAFLNSAEPLILPALPETKVTGYIDGVVEANGAYFVLGWACQTHIDATVTLSMTTLSLTGEDIVVSSEVPTNVIAEEAVALACNSPEGRHRFRIKIPEQAITEHPGQPLNITAHAAYGEQSAELFKVKPIFLPDSLPTLMPQNRQPNVIVIFTDDQGYADLSVQEALDDVYTPNIDALANNGVRFTNGYVTAPQCSPSRAAMLTGQYQQRFKMDENQHIPMTTEVETLATKFKSVDYATGMLGKWHLEIQNNSLEWGQQNYPQMSPFRVDQVPFEEQLDYYPHRRGFDEMFAGYSYKYLRNSSMKAERIDTEYYFDSTFRVELVNQMSLSFVDKYWRKPFFLYVSPYAPHVPLEATQKYLDRFPGDMPERRRYALAMMAAIDDGVGGLVSKLKNYNLLDNTIIVFLSDNGAPLADDMTDAPIADRREGWNGSRNDPFTGEKGMLTEGALRVPFIMHWPNRIAAGSVIDTPVSALDVGYTAVKEAGVESLNNLDGVDLMPLINGDSREFDERPLFWRFYFQRAIRKGNWKYMQAGIQREYLFDMTQSEPERVNLINSYPDIADQLRDEYWRWANEMPRPEPLVEIPKPFANRVDLYLPPALP
jgi:arylsulfatase A-like enzyme